MALRRIALPLCSSSPKAHALLKNQILMEVNMESRRKGNFTAALTIHHPEGTSTELQERTYALSQMPRVVARGALSCAGAMAK